MMRIKDETLYFCYYACCQEFRAVTEFYCQGLALYNEGILGQHYDYVAVAFIQLQSDLKLALLTATEYSACYPSGTKCNMSDPNTPWTSGL